MRLKHFLKTVERLFGYFSEMLEEYGSGAYDNKAKVKTFYL